MNITSMSGQDLYLLLSGREEMRPVSRLRTDLTENEKERMAKPQTWQANNNAEDNAFWLTLTEKYIPTIDTSSVGSVLSSGIGSTYKPDMFTGSIFSSTATSDEVAKHFADIGRRLDEAYTDGKFTEDEYNELNASLKEYATKEIEKWDYRRAHIQASREISNADWQAIMNGTFVSVGPNKNPQKIDDKAMETIKKAIEDMLNRNGFRTDMAKMWDKINEFRKDLTMSIISNTPTNNGSLDSKA